jgi:phage shock protein A
MKSSHLVDKKFNFKNHYMNILQRIIRIGKAHSHALINDLESPIIMGEQGIRELKDQLQQSIQGLATVKALAIRRKNEAQQHLEKSSEYEQKAMLLIKKAMHGNMDSTESDRLAKEALKRKELEESTSRQVNQEAEQLEMEVAKLQVHIQALKANIAKWESELKTLNARLQISQATKDINLKMTGMDSEGTVDMLKRMKEKVEHEEALANAYGDIVSQSTSVDEEIGKALNTEEETAEVALQKLKDQLKNSPE